MDYFSLKAAAAEAKTRFSRRKVRETSQVSSREAVLIMENEGTLHFSIDPSRPGLFIFDENLHDGSVSSPFADLLDARIRGAILTSVSMPTPGDRIVFLTFKRGWPAKSGEPVSLVLEVMGRHSNLAALHGERILQPMKAVPREKSPRRPFLSGEIWKPPPLRPGLPPEEVRLENLPAPFPARPF